jgi:tetratricopeptide (TPR) repeat protein
MKNFITALLGLLCFVQPSSAFADKCDDVANKASDIFHQARDASDRQDYARAVELYEEAGQYYKEASQMKNCRCPKIESSASSNVEICKRNADSNRKAVENQHNYAEELQVFEKYNHASSLFNKGNTFARNQQWDLAVSSFEEAETIWRSIDSSSENGKNAQQSADQARKLADLARKQM